MTPEEQVRNFIAAVGALGEASKAFYDKLIDQGFSEKQAIYLTGQFLIALMGKDNDPD